MEFTVRSINDMIAKLARDVGRLRADLAAEAAARTAADAKLQANIDAEAKTRAAADTTLQNNINAEAATRAATDLSLQANITAEADAREAADAALQANIDAEADAREAADAVLQANINAEKDARIAADVQLQTNINTEATTRQGADTTESTARATADTALQVNIDAEVAARTAADTVLQTAINTETTNREAADADIIVRRLGGWRERAGVPARARAAPHSAQPAVACAAVPSGTARAACACPLRTPLHTPARSRPTRPHRRSCCRPSSRTPPTRTPRSSSTPALMASCPTCWSRCGSVLPGRWWWQGLSDSAGAGDGSGWLGVPRMQGPPAHLLQDASACTLPHACMRLQPSLQPACRLAAALASWQLPAMVTAAAACR